MIIGSMGLWVFRSPGLWVFGSLGLWVFGSLGLWVNPLEIKIMATDGFDTLLSRQSNRRGGGGFLFEGEGEFSGGVFLIFSTLILHDSLSVHN